MRELSASRLAAGFTRRGLAGLIAWPAAGPVFRVELASVARPPWTPGASHTRQVPRPRDEGITIACPPLISEETSEAAGKASADNSKQSQVVRFNKAIPASPERGSPGPAESKLAWGAAASYQSITRGGDRRTTTRGLLRRRLGLCKPSTAQAGRTP